VINFHTKDGSENVRIDWKYSNNHGECELTEKDEILLMNVKKFACRGVFGIING